MQRTDNLVAKRLELPAYYNQTTAELSRSHTSASLSLDYTVREHNIKLYNYGDADDHCLHAIAPYNMSLNIFYPSHPHIRSAVQMLQ